MIVLQVDHHPLALVHFHLPRSESYPKVARDCQTMVELLISLQAYTCVNAVE